MINGYRLSPMKLKGKNVNKHLTIDGRIVVKEKLEQCVV
jgi:hypothetical protein